MTTTPSATADPSETATDPGETEGTMRALVKARRDAGLDYVEDRPLPRGSHGLTGEPGPTEVLIRVNKAGVCGTDRHIYEWDEWSQDRIPTGIVTGHEFAGVVEKVGEDVRRFAPGMRVSGEGHITRWEDYNSRTGNAHIARDTRILGVDCDGCFAEYILLPQSNVWPLHDEIPDEHGAVMDPLGNAVHTVMEAGVSAQSVLITGVGIIGLMSVSVARAAGASTIYVTDTNRARLELAKELGADEAFHAIDDEGFVQAIREKTRGEGVDNLLEMSGSPAAIDQGFDALRNGGTAALLGIPSRPFEFDLTKKVIFKGAKVLGINGRRMWETWYQMETFLLSGSLGLERIITHELPMERYEEAFRLMQTGEGIKIVLDVSGG